MSQEQLFALIEEYELRQGPVDHPNTPEALSGLEVDPSTHKREVRLSWHEFCDLQR
jgi:hypothetical protein